MRHNKFRIKAFGILEVNIATLIFMIILLISLNIVVSVSAKAPSKREFLRVDRYRDSLVRVFTKHGYAGEVELSESWGKIIVENMHVLQSYDINRNHRFNGTDWHIFLDGIIWA